MKLIVGLGNPGERYESTRHNLGFLVIDHFLKDVEPVSKSNFRREEKLKSEIYIFDYKPKKGEINKIILAKPLTYINNSGLAVSLLSNYYKIKPQDIWIIHDELDLPLGFIKIKLGGSSAGHHGIDSIIKSLSTDKFWRFRLGIGEQKLKIKNLPAGRQVKKLKIKNTERFVLGGFGRSDKGKLKQMVKKGAKAVQTALEKDINSAMNQFNTK